MQSARICICYVLLLCAASVFSLESKLDAEQFKSALSEHLSALQPANVFRGDNLRGQSSVEGLSPRHRDLKQTLDGDCFWDDRDYVCRVSLAAYVDLLEDVNNPVSIFVHKEISCWTALDKKTCEDLDCLWLPTGTCTYTIEDHEDLIGTRKCGEDARHLLEIGVWSNECRSLHTEPRCKREKMCAWRGNTCTFDHWYYYHDIDSKNHWPEKVDELSESRFIELMDGVRDAINRGDIFYAEDIADWDAPALYCPADYEELMCNYVEALTPHMLQWISCNMQDAGECTIDPSCTYNITDGCSLSEETNGRLLLKAEEEFAKEIEDEDARDLYLLGIDCRLSRSEDTCHEHDHCQWDYADEDCFVSMKWSQKEIRRIVGDTEDDVCKFLTIDLDSGCLDVEDGDECEASDACMYVESVDTCMASLHHYVSFALSESDEALDDLEKADKDCGMASTRTRCAAVDI